MKKLVISGSSKLYERALYWRGYFEGRGYEVIDWPRPLFEDEDLLAEEPPAPGLPLGRLIRPSDSAYADGMTKFYQQFYKHLDQTDFHFVMNEDKNGIEGYIGPGTIAELTYSIINNLNRGHKTEIQLLKMPSKDQNCYDEVKFWLDQDWIKIYRRPTGKKATIPVPDNRPEEIQAPAELSSGEAIPESSEESPESSEHSVPEGEILEPLPKHGFFDRDNRSIDILTCNKKCLKFLTPEVREYLKILSPDFPAWLLRYIAAPEMQRLSTVSMVNIDYNALYQLSGFNNVLQHSIGVALIIWKFTRDKKQTLAGLLHDIASPAFKHCIDYMNGDSEKQESLESQTEQIIRNSRVLMKQLKKDGILPSEVSDYHVYPIADNDAPGLAADRLEYTFSNGLFLFDTWDLEKVKYFYNNITVLKNENDLDELGFRDQSVCAEYVETTLPLYAIYNSDKSRAILQFIADILKSMIISGYLSMDDLFAMSEREIIDWILSCGDKTLSEAFRQFQRATTIYTGGISKKNCYCTNVKGKIRYIVPLVATETDDEEPSSERITKLSNKINRLVKAHLEEKGAKYVGFDFDFKPYTE